jgi:hypothetical protein
MTARETGTLPAPLTPVDCDLRDFAFMPLDVVRLRDSDLAVTSEADEFRCAVLLWCASWHQVPAASLPDDDKALAQYAGYGRVVKEWLKVRAGALRGWVKCADGRLYHAVVAEKANEAWLAKLRQRLKTECARIKKHNERHGTKLPFPEFDAWMGAGCPVGQPLFVPSDNLKASPGQGEGVGGDNAQKSQGTPDGVASESDSKGQGEGQGQSINSPKPPDGGSKGRAPRIELKTFLEDCKAKGERPVRDYTPLWNYVKDAHLPVDFVSLAWVEFMRRFGPGGVKERSKQANWRQAFRNYVERNYLKLWAIDANGEYFLTTQGKQAQKTAESKEAA